MIQTVVVGKVELVELSIVIIICRLMIYTHFDEGFLEEILYWTKKYNINIFYKKKLNNDKQK